MRKFDFRLERVLRLRQQLEDLQKVNTARQEATVHERERIRLELDSMTERTGEELIGSRGRRFTAQHQVEQYRYLSRLQDESAVAAKDLEGAREKLHAEHRRLIERRRDRRTLERLKEREFDTWRKESEQEEQALLDEAGQVAEIRRRREKGSVFLTLLLLLLLLAAGGFCALVWRNWLVTGDVGFPLLRAPFESLQENRVREEILAFETEQQMRRKRRDQERLASGEAEPAVVTEMDTESLRRTLQRIEQQQEELRRKEEELRSREIMLDRDRREFLADMNRLTTAQQRIDERLAELKSIEDNRTRQMSAEKEARIQSLTKTISSQNPKQAASLLLATAFPDRTDPNSPPYPPGAAFEEADLVVEILHRMKEKDRADILDRMVREEPAETALLLDMLDNVRTGLEPARVSEAVPGTP
jgi:flagellar FliJ protein